MSTLSKLARGSALRITETLVAIATGFIMLPLMIHYLGESLYGLWIIIGGFVASLYLFDFGFSASVTRYAARAISRSDHHDANVTINTGILVYSLLGLIILAATVIIIFFTPSIMDDQSQVPLAQTLVLLSGLNIAIGFPFKAFTGIPDAYLRYDLLSLVRVVIKILSTAALILALYLGYQLIAVAIIGLITSLVFDFVYYWIARYLYPPLKLSPSLISRERLKELSSYSAWAFIIDINRLARQKADIFVIGAFLGTSLLTIYYVSSRLADYAIQLLNRATNMATPIYIEQLTNQKFQEAKDTLFLFLRIHFILGFAMFLCFIVGGDLLIRLWMGDSFDYGLSYAILLSMFMGRTVTFSFMPFQSMMMAAGTHKYLAYLNIVETALSVSAMIIVVKVFDLGLLAIALSGAIPAVCLRIFFLPSLVKQILDVTRWEIIKALSYFALCFLVSTSIGLGVKTMLTWPDWAEMLIATGLALAVLFGSVFPGLSSKEKGYARRILRRGK
jgi:O-antigen/teichoic acid export membrane protein